MPDCKAIFVWFLRVLKGVAALTLVLNIASCGLIAKGGIDSPTLDNYNKSFVVLAQFGYIIISCLLILAEVELKWFMKMMNLLHFWGGRGLALGWVGIEAINSVSQLGAAVAGTVNVNVAETIGEVVGWTLIGIGITYLLMSVLCLKSLVGVDSVEDLDVHFIPVASASSPVDSAVGLNSASSDADANEIISNAATALGLTDREIRIKFSGKHGKQAAEKMFNDARELQRQSYLPPNKEEPKMKENKPSAAPKGSASPQSTPIGTGAQQSADTRRSKLDDDDELEKAYYSQKFD
jgi:hypothetical protein